MGFVCNWDNTAGRVVKAEVGYRAMCTQTLKPVA